MERAELDRLADRIERVFLAHRLHVRVQGGVVRRLVIHFHLAVAPGLPAGRLATAETDLALALNAPTARVMRCDGIWALEVPRSDVPPLSLVRLQAALPPLPVYSALVGRDETGSPLLLRLASREIANVLVTGKDIAGRSGMVQTLLTSLALIHGPDDLRMMLVHANSQGLAAFDGLPHLLWPTLPGTDKVAGRLNWLAEEAAWREESGVTTPVVLAVLEDLDGLLGKEPAWEPVLDAVLRGPTGIHVLATARRPAGPVLRNGSFTYRIAGPDTDSPPRGGLDWLLSVAGDQVRLQAAGVNQDEITVLVEMFNESPPPQSVTAPTSDLPRGLGDWLRRLFRPAVTVLADAR